MLDIRHFRSLIAIHESGKITEAARRVHLSQSALSHQIKAIESHYGISLFDRSRSGIVFTPAGERFLELARDVMLKITDAERDIVRMQTDVKGQLRIVLECHTCFDWLMPVMDEFRRRWPEVEVDFVAGFHAKPLDLLSEGMADIVIGELPTKHKNLSVTPLFEFEILALMANEHRLSSKKTLTANDFIGETLITYPVPEERIDLIKHVLKPANIELERRTAELTVAIMQLVASRRGLAALPNWGVKNYIDHDYVQGKRIGKKGLWNRLYAIAPMSLASQNHQKDFIQIIRDVCATQLDGITLL